MRDRLLKPWADNYQRMEQQSLQKYQADQETFNRLHGPTLPITGNKAFSQGWPVCEHCGAENMRRDSIAGIKESNARLKADTDKGIKDSAQIIIEQNTLAAKNSRVAAEGHRFLAQSDKIDPTLKDTWVKEFLKASNNRVTYKVQPLDNGGAYITLLRVQ